MSSYRAFSELKIVNGMGKGEDVPVIRLLGFMRRRFSSLVCRCWSMMVLGKQLSLSLSELSNYKNNDISSFLSHLNVLNLRGCLVITAM